MTDLSTLPASKWSDEQIEAYCEEVRSEREAIKEIEAGKDSPYLKGVGKPEKKVEIVAGIRI